MNTRVRFFQVGFLSLILISGFATTGFGGDPRDIVRVELMNDLIKLAQQAQAYYRRPWSAGGGGGSFAGLTANAAGLMKISPFSTYGNASGIFSILTSGLSSSVVLKGTAPARGNNGSPIEVRVNVFPDSMYVTFVN